MDILFVCSGNSKYGISPVVKNQAESLKRVGCRVEFYTIQGKGFWGYIGNITKLRNVIRTRRFIVHAHYSLSAFVSTLAGAKPLVVSLMGSDVHERIWYKWILRILSKYCWDATIVKSRLMQESINLKDVKIISNGVDLLNFREIEKKIACHQLGWSSDKAYVLFAADPTRYEKNYDLARNAFNLLNNPNVVLHHLDHMPISLMPFLYGACDVILLCSLWEGSPNIIKEAMACNCPIVATEVGDVRWVLGDTEGCYIASFDPHDFAEKINTALQYAREKGRTNGRKRIIDLGLDSETVALKIFNVYRNVIKKNNQEI